MRSLPQVTAALLFVATLTVVAAPATPAHASTLPFSAATTLAMENGKACTTLTNGLVACWGRAIHNGMAAFTDVSQSTPAAVPGVSGAADVRPGGGMNCARLTNGTLSCWGAANGFEFDPAVVPGLTGVVDVAIADTTICAVLAGGGVSCWGPNGVGQAGQPLAVTAVGAPTAVPGLTGVTGITSGWDHFCVTRTDFTARCWGGNQTGQLGHDTAGAPDPVPTSPTGLTAVKSIDTGVLHTCAVVVDGESQVVRCWGDNASAKLGFAGADTTVPAAAVAGLTDVVAVAVGAYFSCALLGDQTVECWGGNLRGELGRGSTFAWTATPAPVATLSGVDELEADGATACVRIAQSLKCWGANTFGVLGRGDNVPQFVVPAPVVSGVPEFNPFPPTRLLDTRPNGVTIDGQFQGGGPVAAGATLAVTVVGRDGPGTMKAVALTVTAVQPSAHGYVTVWPCDVAKPNASTLNVRSGVTRANAVVVRPATTGPDVGKVCLSPSISTHLVLDRSGAFPTNSVVTPVAPARLVDTRSTGETVDDVHEKGGALVGGAPATFLIAGRGGLPASTAAAVLNVTAVGPAAAGYLTVWPCDGGPPLASNLNFGTGITVANMVIAGLDDNGEVCVQASAGAHLVIDVTGYMPATTAYEPLVPYRLLDSRPTGTTADGLGEGGGPKTSFNVQIANRVDLMVARTVMLNVVVVNPPATGYLTVYPCGADVPLASNLNFASGTTTANAVIAMVGGWDVVCISTSTAVNVVVDVQGAYAY